MTSTPPIEFRRSHQPILVTGGCGFIGSNIADALAGRGERVVILDKMLRHGGETNAHWLKSRHGDRIEIVTGDVRDRRLLDDILRGVSGVFHLAGQVAVTTSLADPEEDFEINAAGTLRVLEATRRNNPEIPVLFASTNKVYGKLLEDDEIVRRGQQYVCMAPAFASGVSETAPLDLYSPYGCSKGAADQYVHDYARVFGLKTVVMRMSCIYGPRQFGTEDQGWVAHFLIQAIRGAPITIYGDGYQVRDVLFIDDAVAAWLRAFDRIGATRGRVFNLGGGVRNAVSLQDMIRLIADLRGHAPETRFDQWRPGDQAWYVSDVSAISRALDWTPRISPRQGLEMLERWLASQLGAPSRQEAHA
ncbi:MAG: SDR family NAD(P)-dependent oxidoreductase [Xanthobacteraceae bacterium]|nr:SDR family NAD(P)-dependent oxidoreductase [Xanthobacteraceae bacterium]MBV9627770.1 SDR family NAD(P)-dependent oxidoreductase [Xanthobacteraceae bacterium]